MKIAIAQVNLMLGDLNGNVDRLIAEAVKARNAGASLIITPELALCGYPPEDLLFRHDFRLACAGALQRLCAAIDGIAMVVGHPHLVGVPEEGRERLFNAASLIRNGRIVHSYLKQRLPNYQVFDEKRYFETGHKPFVFELDGHKIGVLICEDVWFPQPVAATVKAGAELIVVPNASPYDIQKLETRYDVVRRRVAETGVPILYAHWTGGQDELIFDGASFGVNADGGVGYQEKSFEEALGLVEFVDGAIQGAVHPTLPRVENVYRALVVALRDYVNKNGFPGVLLGLSGGVDSALTLAIAVDALGASRVRAVMMPSAYTAQISLDDSREMAAIHGITYEEITITPVFEAFKTALSEAFAGRAEDTAEENIQARIRGTMLMGLSNKFGAMVVTTGNKSEMAVGYSTLYGDMAGGYAILKDVAKTLVYELCRWRNTRSPVIPERVITRPPSAELRPDQKDQDSLPDYATLDRIVELYMEQDRAPSEIVAAGFLQADVDRVTKLLKINEYKRRQSPVGAKITRRGFGKDWRYPITSKYWPK
ncbi:MAG: NAD+ synthase [Rhodocyclaceae bacterium]|nr:NAD+ synthase [Rhodocyclaceae bacterium]MCA3018447.1 NAD+ synthase [Rhodocyclaceae bacterium]MCA3022514.1 NAD+ synthase [Rhodocyclaceae bacterium]MCA3023894.1 NAD+ synthase [Rhodocyclaceae bacterium]MCA3028080.1 NAD+ synthase [Rhodocyclaceae bacterium]